MSVLARKRAMACTEYAMHFVKLYDYTEERLSKTAKRKRRWLCEPIAARMNGIRDEVMQLYDAYYISDVNRESRCFRIVSMLLKLQKPLLALWNVDRYTEKRMIKWVSMIDREINLIARECGYKGSRKYMYILDYEAVNRLECMRTMCALHKTIYTKTISLPEYCRITKGTALMALADEALFQVSEGNRIIPETAKMLSGREKHLSRALNCVKSMEQPMFAVFNLMNYSNETMEEIARQIAEEEKLLHGLMESDKKRFSALA